MRQPVTHGRRADAGRVAARKPRVRRHQLLGTHVDAFTLDELLNWLDERVQSKQKFVLAGHNVNSLTLLQRHDTFREFYATADGVFVDGMPVIAIAKLLGHPLLREHRVAVLDWVWPFAAQAESAGWHVVHVGGSDEVNERAAAKLAARHPGLHLSAINGYFDSTAGSAESNHVVERLRALAPDVVLVGMGMPRQELWLSENLDALPPAVYIAVGGIAGYLADDRPTAPRWLGQLYLEWAYRIVTEPRRLWRRYLVEPFALAPALLRALIQSRPKR